MRILYLCHRIPYPPNKGEKIRAFHQLRAMATQHEVDLFTLADDAADMIHRTTLENYCRQVTVARVNTKMARLRALPFLLTETPLTVPYFHSTELRLAVRRALVTRTYDRIFVYCSAMAQYLESSDSIPILTDLVDVDSNKWAQYAALSGFPFSVIYRREARCLREFERKICERSACVLVTTEREAQLVRQISASIRVRVVSIGVDLDHLELTERPPESSLPTVVFTGEMSYFPNQDAVTFFARKVLPLIQRSVPGARFLIVGRNPSRKIQELGKIPGVEVTGCVADVRPYLAQAHVSVAPFSIAAGIQTKILEAMACGLPVVATPCAVQALASEVAEVIETGTTAEELASKTICLLRDPRLAERKGLQGRSRVAAAYNWDGILGQLLQLIENPGGVEAAKSEACLPAS